MALWDALLQKLKKEDPAPPGEPIAPDVEAELKRVFGDDIVARIRRLTPSGELAVRNNMYIGLHWLRIGNVPHLVTSTDIVPLRGLAALHMAIEQTVTTSVDPEHRVRRLAELCAIQVYESQTFVDAQFNDVLEQATPALRDRYEPPHFEGHAYVFFCDDPPWQLTTWQQPRNVMRVVIDTESWAMHTEVIGRAAKRAPLMPTYGAALVDDKGNQTVASPSAPSASAAARRWRDAALTEHASVAAFARLTLELMELGAPLSLLARVQQAALDEVKHTQQCLAHARTIDGVDVTLGPLPALKPRSGDKRALAQRVHDEALVPESAAVTAMRAEAGGADEGEARALLLLLADDEERHVQLARDIIAWCEER